MRREVEPLSDRLKKLLSEVDGIRSVVLFGSFARLYSMAKPTYPPSAESDVDVLVVAEKERKQEAESAISRLYSTVEGILGRSVQILIVSEDELREFDPDFLERIAREGLLILGKPIDLPFRSLDLSPYVIVTYDLRGISRKEKLKLNRELFGYVTSKRTGQKVYESRHPGLIERGGGYKLGPASLVVPFGSYGEAVGVLRRYGAAYCVIHVWAYANNLRILRLVKRREREAPIDATRKRARSLAR